MGMDSYLFVAKSKKEFSEGSYWSERDDTTSFHETTHDAVTEGEWWYARKFYDLHEFVVNELLNGEYECGDFVPMTKEMIHKMLHFCIDHPDYFESFDTVPRLCTLLHYFDKIEAAGYHVFYECDW